MWHTMYCYVVEKGNLDLTDHSWSSALRKGSLTHKGLCSVFIWPRGHAFLSLCDFDSKISTHKVVLCAKVEKNLLVAGLFSSPTRSSGLQVAVRLQLPEGRV